MLDMPDVHPSPVPTQIEAARLARDAEDVLYAASRGREFTPSAPDAAGRFLLMQFWEQEAALNKRRDEVGKALDRQAAGGQDPSHLTQAIDAASYNFRHYHD